jgi:gamma-glutamyl:cysteine ligase YbdK (ATP-grasp superfamily)
MIRDLVSDAPSRTADRGDYVQNRWSAACGALDAELIHPDGDRTATARELAEDVLGTAPPEPEALVQLRAADPAASLVARTVG